MTMLLSTTSSWDDTEYAMPRSSKALDVKDDPIALSVAVYNKYKENQGTSGRWAELGTVVASDADRETAKRIRTKYRDRIMILSLKGKPLTKYQTTLYSILNSQVTITEEHLGIIYRLPYFYTEDLAKEALRDRFTHSAVNVMTLVPPVLTEARLTPYTQVLRSRKSQEVNEFWFADQNDNPVMWPVATSNQLFSLAKSLVNFNQPMVVKGYFHHKYDKFADLKYLQLNNMELMH